MKKYTLFLPLFAFAFMAVSKPAAAANFEIGPGDPSEGPNELARNFQEPAGSKELRWARKEFWRKAQVYAHDKEAQQDSRLLSMTEKELREAASNLQSIAKKFNLESEISGDLKVLDFLKVETGTPSGFVFWRGFSNLAWERISLIKSEPFGAWAGFGLNAKIHALAVLKELISKPRPLHEVRAINGLLGVNSLDAYWQELGEVVRNAELKARKLGSMAADSHGSVKALAIGAVALVAGATTSNASARTGEHTADEKAVARLEPFVHSYDRAALLFGALKSTTSQAESDGILKNYEIAPANWDQVRKIASGSAN